MQINRTTLANGLRLVHSEDTSTQMVCVNILYQVGSRNESPDHTGFAHLFEHLMFGGTPRVPDFDLVLQEACGDNNAFTTEDITNYYITIPAQNIETALWLEADRMAGLAFTDQSLEVQRKVVMEEFKLSYLNQPYGDLSHLLFRKAFPKGHPYSWPTIGKKLSHIRTATMEQVKDFFHRYYRPDNAILCLVGNISWERTKQLVEKWFVENEELRMKNEEWKIKNEELRMKNEEYQLPSMEYHGSSLQSSQDSSFSILNSSFNTTQDSSFSILHSSFNTTQDSSFSILHSSFRSVRVHRSVPSDLLLMAFHIPSRLDDRFQVCDMISDVLANGKSSRLYRRLVEQQRLCDSVEAYVEGRLGTGLLIVEAMPIEGVGTKEVEAAIWQELEDLRTQLLTDEELQKVKNKYETNTYILLADYMQRAEQLAYFEMLGDAHWLEADLPRYLAITSDEFRTVSQQVLQRTNATVIHYLAKEE